MAVFTRTNGNAQIVAATGTGPWGSEANSLLVPISTGIGKPVQCFRILSNSASFATEMGTGEAVEAALRTLGIQSTLLVYQVNTVAISTMVEESAWNATDLQANLQALGTTVGTNSFNFSGVTVSDAGFKLTT